MFDRAIKDSQPRLDRTILVAVVGLMLFGVAFIYSATVMNEAKRGLHFYQQNFFKQSIWYGIGTVCAAAICLVSYHRITRWALVIYWATILLLVLVLIPGIGTHHGWGAMRWIDLGPVQLQPSEFTKLGFILAMAHFLSRPTDELKQIKTFWKAVGMGLLPFVLIMREPDLGSALILIPISGVMLLVAGTPLKYLTKILVVGFILMSLVLVDVLFAPEKGSIKLKNYQRKRLMVFFGLDYNRFAPANATPAERQRLRIEQDNDSYNSRQALISVGSGGLTGKGWCQGSQIALGYLPRDVAHNDFIFSVIAEEKGFIGSAFVVILYGAILFAGIRIAGQARDRLGKLLAVGVVALFFSHVFINIGMNIRIMPIAGVPLPLLSYGGSSVLCSLIAIGLLQNVYIYRRDY